MFTNIADIMSMVRDGFDVVISVRIEMSPTLPMISPTLNHMPQVRNHTGCNKRLSVIVEVNTPRVAGSVHKRFKDIASRMVPPDRSVQRKTLFFTITGASHTGMCEDAVAAIQPSVRSPDE